MLIKEGRRIVVPLGWVLAIALLLAQAALAQEAVQAQPRVEVSAKSAACVECHEKSEPGIIEHWKGSTHAREGVGCVGCHRAEKGEADGFEHYGVLIHSVVTPRNCARCHEDVVVEFESSHHSKAGNILASLDNFLAETVEGSRVAFSPYSPTPGKAIENVSGMSSAFSGCQQCHGSIVALQSTDGGTVTVDDLKPGAGGKPTNQDAVSRIKKDDKGKPLYHPSTWPNTGIGRLNLDGSRGSCSACHSRHDFSPRRARQPENCGKCHLGPDHPQKEIYEESKHGVAYRDLREHMNLNAEKWVLGKDYSQAPTCATCHMSGNLKNGGRITHDPGERISWTNRPPVSVVMDTDRDHKIVTETDLEKRRELIVDTAEDKRNRMKQVCSHCHTPDYVNSFYKQYDGLVVLYNEKFAKPGQAIMSGLYKNGLLTKTQFDEEIEWTWYFLWHHEGRRARHGAGMMAPDYTHWHGMFEVAERFYMKLIPQAREIIKHAAESGKAEQSKAAQAVLDAVLARPEHIWLIQGAEGDALRIQKAMEERYGKR